MKEQKEYQVTKLTRQVVKVIWNDATKALMPIAKEYGLELDRNGCSFSIIDGNIRVKYEFWVKNHKSVEKVDQTTVDTGLAPRGTRIMLNGKYYIIKRSMRVNYIAVSEEDDKLYTIPFESARVC